MDKYIILISQLVSAAGIIFGGVVYLHKIFDGQRCLLRTEMLRIYYRNLDAKVIRQYEFENFMFCYAAYKNLKGNSFVDKICDEVKKWKVVS